MSEQPHDYLVSTYFSFGGRSIVVRVEHDGFSYWTDESAARNRFQETGKSGIDILAGDHQAARQLSQIYDEHTIRVEVPEEALRLIQEDLSPRYWSASADDADLDNKLDEILEPLFWEQVNPYLSPPCTRGKAE